jgi:hypothetical protein
MKYFVSEDHWDVVGYWEQIHSIKPRISQRAYRFFSKHSFHDAKVEYFKIQNIRPPFGKRQCDNPTNCCAKLVEYGGDNEFIVFWKNVSKIDISFDTRARTFISENGEEKPQEKDYIGLDWWCYDEITVFDEKYLSHEIMLCSGDKIRLLFKTMNYKRKKLV